MPQGGYSDKKKLRTNNRLIMHRADEIKILEMRIRNIFAKKTIKQKDIDVSNEYIKRWKYLTKYNEN